MSFLKVRMYWEVIENIYMVSRNWVRFLPLAYTYWSMVSIGWACRQQQKVCPGCISETIRCRKLILSRDISWGCRWAMSWCDIDLIFVLAVVTLSSKVLCWLYLRNCEVYPFNGCVFTFKAVGSR